MASKDLSVYRGSDRSNGVTESYILRRNPEGQGGWEAQYFDRSGRLVGTGKSTFSARAARRRAASEARDNLRKEIGRLRKKRPAKRATSWRTRR